MSKRSYKEFPLYSIEKGMQALGSLIANVIVNLNKYKEYCLEVDYLLNKYNELNESNTEEINIPAKEYEDINDKLLYRQFQLLKYIADHQKNSFSYIHLRDQLVKYNYIKRDLGIETKKILKEFLDIRNWSFHNPQSILVAAKESTIKRLPKELAEDVTILPQLNPVMIDKVILYDINTLVSLKLHGMIKTEQFEGILQDMKTDYSEMYEKYDHKVIVFSNGRLTQDIVYSENQRISRITDKLNDVLQISMAIQKSKYDGSNKSFEDCVIKKPSTKNN